MSAHYENEFGRVAIGHSIIKQVILPEIVATKCFRPLDMKSGMDVNRQPLPKSLEKSIRISDEDNRLEATILLSVLYGTSITDEGAKLKKRIRQAVESATGLKLSEVVLNVEKVHCATDLSSEKVAEAEK